MTITNNRFLQQGSVAPTFRILGNDEMSEIAGVNGLPTVPILEKDEVGISGLEAADFLQMLIVQLQNQDPTDPTSNEEVLTQVSQLRDLQASTDLSDSLAAMVRGSELSNAAGLIGQFITGRNSEGDVVQGVATSARVVDGEAVLKINGQDVKLSDVDSVSTPPDTTDGETDAAA